MEYNKYLVHEWISAVKEYKSPLVVVILTHLMTEHSIDYLIFTNCQNRNVILDDHRAYSFSVKLNIVFAMGLIPEHLYQNIKKLNKLRNEYGHNLKADFTKADLDYYDPDQLCNIKDFKKKLGENSY